MKKQFLVGACLAALVATYSARSNMSPEQKQPERKQTVQSWIRPEAPVGIEIKTVENSGYATGMTLHFSRAQRASLQKYVTVWYEIPEQKISFPLPVEDGLATADTRFPRKERLDQTTFILYGISRDTGDRQEIHKQTLFCRFD